MLCHVMFCCFLFALLTLCWYHIAAENHVTSLSLLPASTPLCSICCIQDQGRTRGASLMLAWMCCAIHVIYCTKFDLCCAVLCCTVGLVWYGVIYLLHVHILSVVFPFLHLDQRVWVIPWSNVKHVMSMYINVVIWE